MQCAIRSIAAVAALLPAVTIAADAVVNYPNRPIRLVVPQNPGASNDTISRIVAVRLGEVLGQPVVVDNRPGAGGTIGGERDARRADALHDRNCPAVDRAADH
jgi:tripartite-type tricarboxylate transporter receptor subunit TctC